MFERFTESSKAVLVEAQDLAVELGSGHSSVGHLLYGCAEGREETAGEPLRECGITAVSIRRLLPQAADPTTDATDPEALRAIGIDYEGVRAAVEASFGPGALENAPDRRVPSSRTRRPPFTPNAKRSLELALRAAQELHQHRIVPGHLLLGLLRLDPQPRRRLHRSQRGSEHGPDNELVSSIIEMSGTTAATLSAAVLARLAAAVE
ncbi:MAG TPA: Clp protease N-terminal domain-containing protein [Acidimicrobiales bacterium]|nr:Clp protease N-terminal domain-containing protein [Acidimicrobiales bacterium]